MADVDVQRDVATIPLSGLDVTITAGVHYVAPASASSAFIRIIGTAQVGGGLEDTDFTGDPRNLTTIVSGNITSSITFSRGSAVGGPIEISWEIQEYTGAIGGANEFKVRAAEEVTANSGVATADSASISGVVDPDDVVVWITGLDTVSGAGRRAAEIFQFTSEYISGSTLARLTRGGTFSSTVNASIAVVEYTGSNWKIQRIPHTYVLGATDEAESMVAVGSISKAFIHHLSRISGTDVEAQGLSQNVHISSTTQLTFRKQNIEDGATGVAWVIENTQASGNVMKVQQLSGTRASNVGGNPDTFTQAITAVASLSESSIVGEGSYTVTTSADLHKNMLTFELTGLSTVTLHRGRDVSSRDWRYQVVEWPTASAAVTAVLTGTAIPTATEAEYVAGGKTIIITLTGDTLVT